MIRMFLISHNLCALMKSIPVMIVISCIPRSALIKTSLSHTCICTTLLRSIEDHP